MVINTNRKMYMCIALLATAITTVAIACEPTWDGLRVTFGLNQSDPNVFASLPRTEAAAESDGWTKIADCNCQGKFRGIRYVKNMDYAVSLLFDVNGFIAGIQCSIAKPGSPDEFPPVKQRDNIFQDDGQHYTLTAYFVHPAAICTDGRKASEFLQDGTGTGLYIQNGSDPVTQSVHIPFLESDVGSTSWTLGRCFPTMGTHYWYSLTTDMSCDDIQPLFLLYNKEKQLTAFGWALVGTWQNSSRFEHPPRNAFAAFINPVPTCLDNVTHFSTMHIYFIANPALISC